MADINKLEDHIKSTIYPNGKGAINASDHQALLLDMAAGMAETDTKLTELSKDTGAFAQELAFAKNDIETLKNEKVFLTKAEYDSLEEKDEAKLYFVFEK